MNAINNVLCSPVLLYAWIHTMAWIGPVLAVLLATAELASSTSREEWNRWKLLHEKSYESELEEETRLRIWQHNHRFVETHNMANLSYTLALNHFADLVSLQLLIL